MNYYIRIINMPPTIKGFVSLDGEGFYNIYINADISEEERQKAIRHELDHISKGHLESDITAADAEREVS